MNLYGVLERIRFRSFMRRTFRIEMRGTERIPAGSPAILVANHESMFDPWLLALATPRPVRYMAKAELWRVGLVGRALEAFGAFPVERGTGDGSAMSRAASLLHAGEVIGIFPQGTSKQLPERVFHRGAARLALATGAPVVPVRLIGTRGFPRPGRRATEVHVGEPIFVEPVKPTVARARESSRRDSSRQSRRCRDREPVAAVAARLGRGRPAPAGILYLIQRRSRDATAVDAGWAGSLVLIAALVAAFGPGELEHRLLILALAGLENLRIASLVRGRLGKGEDTRYQELRRRWREGREQRSPSRSSTRRRRSWQPCSRCRSC